MVVVYSIVVLAGFLAGASASVYKPDVIHLPTGFFPEGIEIGDDWDVYVGSIGGKRMIALLVLCCRREQGGL